MKYLLKLTKDEEGKSIKSIIESGELTIDNIGTIRLYVSQHPTAYSPDKFFKGTYSIAKKLKERLKEKLLEI